MNITKKILVAALAVFALPNMISAAGVEVDTAEELKTAVKQDNEIKIIDNIDISENGIVVEANVSIDLNGKTITVLNGEGKNIEVKQGAKLTIDDKSAVKTGKIINNGQSSKYNLSNIFVKGSLVLNGGTIEAVSFDSKSAKAIYVASANDTDLATVTVNGGTIKSDNMGISNHNTIGGDTKIVINGGTIDTKGINIYGIYTYPLISKHDVIITGGVFKTEHSANLDIKNSNMAYNAGVKPEIKISGGEFTATGKDTRNNLYVGLYENVSPSLEDIKKYFDIEISGGKYSHGVSNFKSFLPIGMYQKHVDEWYVVTIPEVLDSVIPDEINKPFFTLENEKDFNSTILDSVLENSSLANDILSAQNEVTTSIKVEEQKNLNSDIKKQLDKVLPKEGTLLGFYDIKAIINVDGVENEVPELSSTVKLSILLPDDIKAVKKGMTRKYYVAREHNGVVEILDATLNNGKLEFESDKFSTYAVKYVDSKVVVNPDTGINFGLYILVLMTGIAGVVTTLKLRKN